jgi:dTDP-4-dehydrorhamnose reductase
MKKKFLILGASGQLGNEFQQVFSHRDIEYFAPDESTANILDYKAIEELTIALRPDIVINCAAYNAVDDAETNPTSAFKVNSDAVGALAELCRREKMFLVHYSSDYVFDGKKEDFYTEQDIPAPLNVYGKSKLAGEKAVLDILPASLIFRLSWVIGKGKQNFLYKLVQWAANNLVLKISADETSVPTFTHDIVNATLLSLEENLEGLFHLTNSDYASRYELARYFLKKANFNNIVIPVPVNYFKTLAERPIFTVMSNQKLSIALDTTIPDWREGVDRCIPYFLNQE